MFKNIKKPIRKAIEALQKSRAANKQTTGKQITGGFMGGIGKAISKARETGNFVRKSKPERGALARAAGSAMAGRKSPVGGFMKGVGNAISKTREAAAAARKKKEEEEDNKPAAFKKGGMVKKGRGMGAATKGGGACAPRKPRKMMGGGMAKAYQKGGMASSCK